MALSTLIKISGIHNLSDARYNAGMGAAILGFCPEPGNRDFVEIKKFREITGWIEGVKLAGEFYSSEAGEILRMAEDYKFDYIQLGNENSADEVFASGIPVIFRFDLSEMKDIDDMPEIMDRLKAGIMYFLIEGESRDIDITKKICGWSDRFPVILGSGINSSNILSLLNNCGFAGFAFKGGNEIKPGYFDPGMLSEIFEILENNS
jgi:phosphoribosylanthranilate isomerase